LLLFVANLGDLLFAACDGLRKTYRAIEYAARQSNSRYRVEIFGSNRAENQAPASSKRMITILKMIRSKRKLKRMNGCALATGMAK
jgi:hypothetical protein